MLTLLREFFLEPNFPGALGSTLRLECVSQFLHFIHSDRRLQYTDELEAPPNQQKQMIEQRSKVTAKQNDLTPKQDENKTKTKMSIFVPHPTTRTTETRTIRSRTSFHLANSSDLITKTSVPPSPPSPPHPLLTIFILPNLT